jgi:hypothetical protein
VLAVVDHKQARLGIQIAISPFQDVRYCPFIQGFRRKLRQAINTANEEARCLRDELGSEGRFSYAWLSD